MSTRFYACEDCEKWIGNGALTREHLQVHPEHIFTEFWNRDGRPPKVRKVTIQSIHTHPSEINDELKGDSTNEKLDKILENLEKNTDLQKKIASILLRMNERDCNREELYEALDKLAKEGFFFRSK